MKKRVHITLHIVVNVGRSPWLLFAILVPVFTLCAISLIGHAQPKILHPRTFSEKMREKIPIRGGVHKGVTVARPDAKIEPDGLILWLPVIREERLCVTLDSQDGRYHAEVEYDLLSEPAGQYRLALPTRYATELRKYRARDLAVSAHIGRTCTDRGDLLIPAHWGTEPPETDRILVLVNSQGTDVRIYSVKDDKYFRCTRSPNQNRIAYDTECRIDVTSGSGVIEFILLRDRYETSLEPVSFRVYLP